MSRWMKIAGLLASGLVGCGTWFYGLPMPGHGGLSASEVFAIEQAVRQQTGEPFIRVHGEGIGAATVITGRRGNGLDGSGMEYNLMRTSKGWQITGRSAWMSLGPNHSIQRTVASRSDHLQFLCQRRLAPAADAERPAECNREGGSNDEGGAPTKRG